jgi:hypothetical protein
MPAGANPINVEMGTQWAGDATNDNVVDITDFDMLKMAFGRPPSDPAYNARPDFDGNTIVDTADFNLLLGNFGRAGAAPPQ